MNLKENLFRLNQFVTLWELIIQLSWKKLKRMKFWVQLSPSGGQLELMEKFIKWPVFPLN